MNKYLKTSLFMIATGAVIAGIGVFFTGLSREQLARCTEPASAVLVEYEEDTEYDSASKTYDTVYYPVVTYEAEGKAIQSRYSQSEPDKAYEVGQNIDIQYNPDDPEEFIISAESDSFRFGALWEVPLGVILALVGLGRIIVPMIFAARK